MTRHITTLFVLLSVTVFGQKRNITVDDFTEFSLGIPGYVIIEQGNKNELIIDCDDDTFEKLRIEEDGSKLTIGQKKYGGWNSWSMGKSSIRIYLTMKDISALNLSGSGDIESKGKLKTDDLELKISGSGDMDLEIVSDEVDFKISGSGSITTRGTGNSAIAKISGSGKIKAEDLEVKNFEAKISGSGNCYITASESIIAKISGSGNIYYKGNPNKLISDSSGSGKIRKL